MRRTGPFGALSRWGQIKSAFSDFFDFSIEILLPVGVLALCILAICFAVAYGLETLTTTNQEVRLACLEAGWPEVEWAEGKAFCKNHERAVPVPMGEVEK